MRHGAFIEEGLSDWQIVQHKNGSAKVTISGSWIVIKDAVKIGVESAYVIIRVMHEDDNSQVIPWQKVTCVPEEDSVTGTWSTTLDIPAGGLYRIETGLKVVSTRPGIIWTFRGDMRMHIGVGDVFVIAGQSNAAGTGRDAVYDPPELGVHLFRNKHQWDLAVHPFNESTDGADAPNAERGIAGTSPFLSFGKLFKKLSHYPVGMIATAMGGMPIKRWNPDGGKLYVNMMEQIKACGDIAGIIWYQGCSNTDENGRQDYKQKLYDVFEGFRRDLGEDVKIFTCQLNREIDSTEDVGYGTVREIQRQAVHDFKDLFILPTVHCSLSDAIHNNSHSNLMLGEAIAKQCGHVLYGTMDYEAPEISDAVLTEGTKLTMNFEHMKLAFILPSVKEGHCGFTVHDENGEVPYGTLKYSLEHPHQICMELEHAPKGECSVSFAWKANPERDLPLDEVTYLPPLSFYKYPVKK